ncbi:MAG TPA: sigma-70 family RNA polymerase sigma factor [Solirubrobacteraceae bacterium]|nr:sigma-70 family RNA polymerase sigma factor [Solirubrobacteraceae bacterium]
MEVRARRSEGKRRNGSRGSITAVREPGTGPGLTANYVADTLMAWRNAELRIARGFPECGGLSKEELEDIYQDTVEALLKRHYASEDHLRFALRAGIRHRASHHHRDEGRREEIRADPRLGLAEEEDHDSTEHAALMGEDRLVVTEFLSELTALEQRVFWLQAEGMKYRSIAKALNIELNAARNAVRSCEPKRARFQLLYDTGRLCGYRATTIQALQAGEATSEQLASQAFAHLSHCASCRAQYQTNATRLRHSFQRQAAALLPIPALLRRVGWLTRLDARARTLQHRIAPSGVPFGAGGVRERATALLAGGGAFAKIAAGVATLAVISTIGASHILEHKTATHQHQHRQARVTTAPAPAPAPASSIAPRPRPTRRARRVTRPVSRPKARQRPPSKATSTASGQYEPGGFAYLGVPTESRSTSESSTSQTGGGPFGP